ncbi:uncharacterized protein LOC134533384 [Bacillus rossius redtenbacheri]|uniref:uncharacterized protein LOC134533384 n=1 Tax=Bacillus rossius redtenbacheri TaxID=93214 RepID=UPI002FDDC211
MKKILLRENDDDLFDCPMIENDHILFDKNSKYVYKMIGTQPTGFWIQFVATFRAHMYAQGYVAWMDERLALAEQAFVTMLDALTEEDCELRNKRISKIFTDVKILQSTYGVKDCQQFSSLRSLSGKPWASSLSSPQAQQALVRLYGTNEHVAKTSRVFLLWSRFAGALAVCFKRWKRAGPARDGRAAPWTPPAHWRDKGKRARALTFELRLKTRWAYGLGRLTGVPASSIAWLPSLDAEELKALLGRLPLYSGTQLEAYRAAPLSPWDADADSYLRALARGSPGTLPLVPYTCPPPPPPPRHSPRDDRRSYLNRGQMMLLQYFIEEMMFRSFVREVYRRAGSSSDTDDEVDQEEGLRSCANCSVPEPQPGYYKICKLCKVERVSTPRFYCSRQCQVYDWKRFHKREHKRK